MFSLAFCIITLAVLFSSTTAQLDGIVIGTHYCDTADCSGIVTGSTNLDIHSSCQQICSPCDSTTCSYQTGAILNNRLLVLDYGTDGTCSSVKSVSDFPCDVCVNVNNRGVSYDCPAVEPTPVNTAPSGIKAHFYCNSPSCSLKNDFVDGGSPTDPVQEVSWDVELDGECKSFCDPCNKQDCFFHKFTRIGNVFVHSTFEDNDCFLLLQQKVFFSDTCTSYTNVTEDDDGPNSFRFSIASVPTQEEPAVSEQPDQFLTEPEPSPEVVEQPEGSQFLAEEPEPSPEVVEQPEGSQFLAEEPEPESFEPQPDQFLAEEQPEAFEPEPQFLAEEPEISEQPEVLEQPEVQSPTSGRVVSLTGTIHCGDQSCSSSSARGQMGVALGACFLMCDPCSRGDCLYHKFSVSEEDGNQIVYRGYMDAQCVTQVMEQSYSCNTCNSYQSSTTKINNGINVVCNYEGTEAANAFDGLTQYKDYSTQFIDDMLLHKDSSFILQVNLLVVLAVFIAQIFL